MLQISFRYYTAFTFEFFHEYYQEEQTDEILFVPSPDSVNKAKRLGLLFKQKGNQLKLLFEEDKKDLLLSLESEELRFSFFLYSKNNYFNNFTQLPVEPPVGKILYFSNTNNKVAGRISQSDFVTESDYATIADLKDSFPGEHPSKKAIAFVEIFTKENLTKLLTSEKIGEDHPNYFIKFAARKTLWKYAIVCRNKKLDQYAEITHSDEKEASFIRVDNEILLNKQEAVIFISKEPMALKQRTEYSLRLIQKDKVSKINEIIPRLPVPTAEMIKPDSRAANSKIYSEVTIYI